MKLRQCARSFITLLAPLVLGLASATSMADTTPVGSTFTYQGRLLDEGQPVSEPVDLVFRLFDQDVAGDPLVTLIANEFAVGDDGRFTIDLDFGGEAFNGEPRWLEIEVNEVVLSPRQPIVAAPHAMVATTAANVPTKAVVGNYFGITGVGTLNSLDVSGLSTFGTGSNALMQIDGGQGSVLLRRDDGTYTTGPTMTLQNTAPQGNSIVGRINFDDSTGTQAGIEYNKNYNGGNSLRLKTGGATRIFVTDTGNVGIGAMPPPSDKLRVAGLIRADSSNLAIHGTTSGAFAIRGDTYWSGSNAAAIAGYINATNPGSNSAGVFGQSGDVGHGSGGTGVRGLHRSGGIGVMGESNGSGTGVYGLVTGNASGGVQYGVRGHSSSDNGYAGYFTGGRNYFQGKVGIGTDDPTFGQLVVQRTASSVFAIEAYQDDLEFPAIFAHNINGPAMWIESLSEASLTGPGAIVVGSVNGSGPNLGIDRNGIMARATGDTSATLRLNPYGGNVHVGEHSAGTGRLITPVLQITGGSDLSERFDVTKLGDLEPQPGMVVCIDPQHPGRLVPCTRAYDRTVAGIISGAGGVNTGMIMGQEGSEADGKHAVALTGRVYVMADAMSGAIEPGDLLTTSDLPGYAMPVGDYARAQGATIGKAMTPLGEGERGLVLVLVSLQ